MTSSPTAARTELTRLLAGLPTIEQLDAVLRAGRLPIDDRSRALIDKGLLRIKHQYADATRQQPDLAKTFASIAQALDTLIEVAFRNDAGRQAVSIMEEEAVWHPPIEVTRYYKVLRGWSETAVFYNQIYDQTQRKNIRRTDPEKWMFYSFYRLYEEIKGARPGIAGPLYRFTMEGAKVLSIKVGITEHAFRMRIQRVLNEQRNKFGSMGSVLSSVL
jgi:hypothetical protein